MAHRSAALLITTEYNVDFALHYRRLRFDCIPRMAHRVARLLK